MQILKKMAGYLALLCAVYLCVASAGTYAPVQTQAAVRNTAELRQEIAAALARGERRITFQASAGYTAAQLQKQIKEAAQQESMLFTGAYTCQIQTQGTMTIYTIVLAKDSLVRVKVLNSRAAAYKAALTALKNSDYKTKFYSETSYYSIFLLMMRQHPEYNYNTSVWKNTNGTYGYGISSELTAQEQAKKMRTADKKAAAVIKSIIKPKMTVVQKVRAIHDYVIRRCSFDWDMKQTDGYEDSLTAYGALMKKKAVCQGYAAAFNLLAQKAGIYSIAVSGTAGGGTHAWNYVKFGGHYRYVDCTWDDNLQKGKQICYEYFNISGKLIATNHYWKKEQFRAGYIKYCKYLI